MSSSTGMPAVASDDPPNGAWVRRTAVSSVLLVALVAAVCSYCHMQHLAQDAGEEWRSWIIPLSVDGMLVASTLAIVDRRRAGLPAGWVPWFGLSLGILASLAANVAAARPDPIARIIAAWPPVAFAVAVETLVIVLRGTATDVPMSPAKSQPGVDTAPAAPIGQDNSQPSSLAPRPDKTPTKTEDDEDRAKTLRRERNRKYQEKKRLEREAEQRPMVDGHTVLQGAQ